MAYISLKAVSAQGSPAIRGRLTSVSPVNSLRRRSQRRISTLILSASMDWMTPSIALWSPSLIGWILRKSLTTFMIWGTPLKYTYADVLDWLADQFNIAITSGS
jgi:hypothetical protein